MTTIAKTTPEAGAAIRNLAAMQLRWSMNHTVTTLGFVPDGKFDYKPSETAKSPREIVVHLIGGNGHIGQSLGMEASSAETPVDRAALIELLKSSTEQVIAKIETVPDEAMDTMVDFLGGKMPMPALLMAGFWHFGRHAGQIDYLETIWGDLEDHF